MATVSIANMRQNLAEKYGKNWVDKKSDQEIVAIFMRMAQQKKGGKKR